MTADTAPLLLNPSGGGKAEELKKRMRIDYLRTWENVKTGKRSSTSRSRRHHGFSFSCISELKNSRKDLSILSIRRDTLKMANSGQEDRGCDEHNIRSEDGFRKKSRLSARSYKNLLKSWAQKAKGPDPSPQRRDEIGQEGDSIKCSGAIEIKEKVVDSNSPCLEMQRVDCNSVSEPSNLDRNSSCVSISEDGVDSEVGLCSEPSEVCEDGNDTQSKESHPNVQIGEEDTVCTVCMLGGDLLHCDGKECENSFHLSCLSPPLVCAPPGVWHCIWCVQKKRQFGVYSVSEGLESILDSRETLTDQEVQRQKQYLVKYKGLAHVHNCWIPEGRLLLEAPMLLRKYKKIQKKIGRTMRWNNQWTIPHRLIQKRLLHFPSDGSLAWHDKEDSDCNYEWLVKWSGLGYDNATWELESFAFMKSPEVVKLVENFESRRKNTRVSHHSTHNKAGEATFSDMSESTSRSVPVIPDQYVSNIDKLRECWHRGQNAIVYDDQERAAKVILFILSSQDDDLPFLIITTSESLSLWEAELSKHESLVNIVVYKGNSRVRAFIRSLEFFNEDGCSMFQILLTTSDIVVEDLRILLDMKWGAIIADECQRPKIYMHLTEIEQLPAEMRLLLGNGPIKETRTSYLKLLSFLEPKQNGMEENDVDEIEHDVLELKERLASFLAFKCNPRTQSFIEYWVPARLSNVQLEQYCNALLSGSTLLCSSSKNDSVTSLPEILTLTRKCCDHPYLVDMDNSLRNRVTSCFPVAERLDVDIEVSGKLQILDKFLLQIKEKGLRVLIIYQVFSGSGLISTRDILDDFLHQRYGEGSYAHIHTGESGFLKKQATMNLFNNEKSNMFVFLMESRACARNIKLCSMDAVILFDSDWDPLNDLKSLQKITIVSQSVQLKVFRLYSSNTVEEKLLILAKQGDSFDGKTNNISRRTGHMLLSWGALHQLNKLDNFHAHDESASHSTITSEHSFINQVVSEFSSLLSSHEENKIPSNSFILEVQQIEGVYPREISLLGEVKARSTCDFPVVEQLMYDEPAHVFWTNILEGRRPRWKFLSRSSKRRNKRSGYSNVWVEETEPTEDASRRKHKEMDDMVEYACLQPRVRNKRKRHRKGEESNLAGHCVSREKAIVNASTVKRGRGAGVGQCDGASIPIIREASASELIGANLSTMQRLSSTIGCSNSQTSQPVSSNLPATCNARDNMPANGNVTVSHSSDHQSRVMMPQPRVGSTGRSNFLLQPTPIPHLQSSVSMPSLGTIGPRISSQTPTSTVAGDNHVLQGPTVPTEVPQSACSDPFQMELERMNKDKEQAIRMHEDTKLLLKTECEKEMDEICKKYEMLLKDAERALLQKKNDLEAYSSKVYANMLLARAFTRESTIANADKSSATCQVNLPALISEISQFCSPDIVLSTNSATLPMTGPPISPKDEDGSSSSGVQHTGGEASQVDPPMNGSPAIPSTPLVNSSIEAQQSAANMNKRLEKSPAPPPIAVSDFNSLMSPKIAVKSRMGTEQSSSPLQKNVSPDSLPVPEAIQQIATRTTMGPGESLQASHATTTAITEQTSGSSPSTHGLSCSSALALATAMSCEPKTVEQASALPLGTPDHFSSVVGPGLHPNFRPPMHYRGNFAGGCEFRAPAPHLRRFRPYDGHPA